MARKKYKGPMAGKMDGKRGRPPKRTKAIERAVLEVFKMGCSIASAAGVAGVAESTVRSWRDADPEFAAEMRKAQAHPSVWGVGTLLQRIQNGPEREKLDALKFYIARFVPEARLESTQQQAAVTDPQDTAQQILDFCELMDGTIAGPLDE